MQVVFVKPAEGGRVRMPDRGGNVMPAEGMLIPRNAYYERLIITGDLVVDEGKTAEHEQKSAPPAPEPLLGTKHPEPTRKAR